jgi:hypothetical protein
MATFSVKNFETFQHYKDRSPPWIRLYNSTLDDYEIGHLPDAVKAHLIAIWLLASRYDNKIPYDSEWISGKINATVPVDLENLIELGFIVPDQACSEMLAERKQSAVPEERRAEDSRAEPLSGLEPDGLNGSAPKGASGKKVANGSNGGGVYPDEFEALWHEYRSIANPNASKADAMKAWKKIPSTERGDCYSGLIQYTVWLSDKRASKDKNVFVPEPQHLSKFINGRGWEPFLERETAI